MLNLQPGAYISYHNSDHLFVLQLVCDLLCSGYEIWMDRLALHPKESWDDSIQSAREQSPLAVIVWSEAYTRSEYCQQEFAELTTQQKSVILLQLHSPLPTDVQETAHTTIDFREWFTTDHYITACEQLSTFLNPMPMRPTEEGQYLLDLIKKLEIRLLGSTSARMIARSDAYPLRPRCHDPAIWLNCGEYHVNLRDHSGQQGKLYVQDVLDWLASNPQMLITGEHDVGKSSLLHTIALYLAHMRLRGDASYPLVLTTSAMAWDAEDDLDVFFNQQWAFDWNLHEYIVRGEVLILLDDVHPDAITQQQIHWLHQWIHSSDQPRIVAASPLEIIGFYDWYIPELQIHTLADEQVQQFVDVVPTPEALAQSVDTSRAWTVDSLIRYLLVNRKILDDGNSIAAPEDTSQYTVAALCTLQEAAGRQHTCDHIDAAMKNLALTQVALHSGKWLDLPAALQAVGSDEILQQAIALHILEPCGTQIAFDSAAVQSYSAAAMLIEDGIYANVSYPQFSEEGQLSLTHKEAFVIDLPRYLHDIDLISTLETITDVNPYLAFRCYLDWQIEDVRILAIIWRSFAKYYQQYLSKQATNEIVRELRQLQERTLASVFVQLLQEHDAGIHVAIYECIARLWQISDDFYPTFTELNLDFPDEFFAAYPIDLQDVVLVSLLKIAESENDFDAGKAIRILGVLRNRASVPLLQDLIKHDDTPLTRAACDALWEIDAALCLTALYTRLCKGDEQGQSDLLDHLARYQRALSARVLTFIACEDEDETQKAALMKLLAHHDEHYLLQYILSSLPSHIFESSQDLVYALLTDQNGDPAMKPLLDALAKKMPMLESQPAFENYVRDIVQHLRRTSPDDNEPPGDIQQLKARLREVVKQNHRHMRKDGDTMPDIPQRILLALEHENWIIRRKGVQQLHNYPIEQALPLLETTLHDPDNQVQIAAIETLPNPADHERVRRALVNTLEVDDYLVVDAAAARLRHAGAAIVPVLIEKLNSAKINTIAATIELLGEIGDARAVQALSRFLNDERMPWLATKSLGDLAAAALVTIGTEEALQAVSALFPNIDQTSDAALLSRVDEPRAEGDELEGILSSLQGNDWQASQEASRKLQEFAKRKRTQGAKRIAHRLLAYLEAENWIVRWAILEALAWLQVPDTAEAISHCLDDENWTVCIAAIRTLMELEAAAYTQQIAACLQSDNGTVREAATEALGILGTAETVPLLQPILNDGDDLVRLAAVKALITIGGNEATRLLLDRKDDQYNHIRWYIAEYLTQFESEKLLRIYVKMLRDLSKPEWEERSVSSLAENAIKNLNTPEANAVLAKWYSIKDEYLKKDGNDESVY